MASGKAALVTGGAKRLGREIALFLGQEGFDIALNYNQSRADAEDVADLVKASGQKCTLFQADLLKQDEVHLLIEEVAKTFPALSLLVNNASIYEKSTFQETDLELFERNFAIHVRAPFFLTQAFANLGVPGQVINITDASVVKNQSDYFAYLLSKKTLSEMTKMCAKALAPAIRVNAIAPGPILVPIDEPETKSEAYHEKGAQHLLLKMPGDPKYILQGLSYLLANPFVTGECLFIDGGEHVKN